MRTNTVEALIAPRPFLKWAGGKGQILDEILKRVPRHYNSYIEPFIGGGAVYFALQPHSATIADSNPELINVYKQVATNVSAVIGHLSTMNNSERDFYRIRALRFSSLTPDYAAARTIYLNRTCYNGLYRVNKSGQFNTPFGRYLNPTICNASSLYGAAKLLRRTQITLGDYKSVLNQSARERDLVYLDPPYLPVSQYSDFKRYTKEQFHEEDHRELAEEVARLHELGCHVILTNSNHPMVHELYGKYDIEVIATRRNVSSQSGARTGEDLIIDIPPKRLFVISPSSIPTVGKVENFPPTRFMGSKEKLLPFIKEATQGLKFESVTDLFSGTGIVGYMYKTLGKRVISNDYMAMNAVLSSAMIENGSEVLHFDEIEALFAPNSAANTFVSDTFRGLYYSDEDNALIDVVRANLCLLKSDHKRKVAMAALIRACLKKRPRGIFTYTGHRYDDGRSDLKTSLADHIRNAARLINSAVFDNSRTNVALLGDAMSLEHDSDLVYIDPPYYSPLSDNEYVRRYHFVEGLARGWDGVEIQWHTKTRKFKSYPTPFSSRLKAHDAFDALFARFRSSIIVLSYSSNSLPTRSELKSLLSKHKSRVEVIDVNHRYSFANQGSTTNSIKNAVKEYLFIGY